MQITASLVKELRERTGAGMMDCKKSLMEADGDIEAAIEAMRKSGAARAAKKAGRIAAEGIIKIKKYADKIIILEINCETDFVSKDNNFLDFSEQVITTIYEKDISDIDSLMLADVDGQSIKELNQQLIAKIGENIAVRRFQKLSFDDVAGYYLHGGRIGVVVELEGGDEQLVKDIAMHVVASKPLYINDDDVPQEIIAKEKDIFFSQAVASKKPEAIIDKIVASKMDKFIKETTLINQPYIKDDKQTVGGLLKSSNAKIKYFIRYEVGEGIEKREDNFVEEVMSQAKGV